MKKQESYKYSEAFQKKIAALCLRDIGFIQKYEDVVDYKYFDYEYLASLIRVSMSLYHRHQEIPSQATIVEEIREYASNYHIPSDVINTVVEQIDTIYEIDLGDAKAVRERVIRFGKRQALKSAIIKVADLIDHDSAFDQVGDIINKALTVGEDIDSAGMQLFGLFQRIPGMAYETHYGVSRIPTMIPEFDRTQHGGTGRGEVWVVMAPPGSGKTQWLINLGCAAIMNEEAVVHITIGDMDHVDVGVRYAARFCKVRIDDVTDNTTEYQERADKLDQLRGRYLRIKYYSPHSVSMPQIRAYLSRLITHDGIKPGLVILDYPEELKPVHENEYQSIGRIYSEIIGIANDFNCAVWTASQIQRFIFDRDRPWEVITKERIADSWRKVAKSDGICSFNRTRQEGNNDRARLYIDKSRRGIDKTTIYLMAYLDQCYIRQVSKEEKLLSKQITGGKAKEDDDE